MNLPETGSVIEAAGTQRPPGPRMCGADPVEEGYTRRDEPRPVDVGVPEYEVVHQLLRRQAAGQPIHRGQNPEVPVVGVAMIPDRPGRPHPRRPGPGWAELPPAPHPPPSLQRQWRGRGSSLGNNQYIRRFTDT